MKRTIRILAAVLAVLIMGTGIMLAEALPMKIEAVSVSARPGETVTVQLQLTGNTGFSYLKITPTYDAAVLTLQESQNGQVSTDAFVSTARALAWDSDRDSTGDGVLAVLTFAVAADAEPGDYTVGLTVNECYNGSEQDVTVEVAPGKVTVRSASDPSDPSQPAPIRYGDINEDGAVNASDALQALQHSVKLITLDGDRITAADVSGDRQVNASDALLILQYSVKLIDTFPVETA